MIMPNLAAMVAGVEKLQSRFRLDDPILQEMVKTSVVMAETYLTTCPDECDLDRDGACLQALRKYQLD